MINTSYNYYREAEKIAKELSREGYGDWSARLIGAIESGSTGTEILMALVWNLKELISSNPSVSPKLRKTIENLISKIDNALR